MYPQKEEIWREIDRTSKSFLENLDKLLTLFHTAVRAEQLLDRLTDLANDDALDEWIQSHIDDGEPFWLAFVEVDKFKDLNTLFGYENADDMLRHIASALRRVGAAPLSSATTAFRAHGDEFFLGGAGDGRQVHETLAHLGSDIADIRIDVAGKAKPMGCTVSIGWASSIDAQATTDGLTNRSLRKVLETAVAHAKRTRNCVVRYTPELEQAACREGRADCPDCGCRFSLSVPVGPDAASTLWCPNCGHAVDRPPSLRAVLSE